MFREEKTLKDSEGSRLGGTYGAGSQSVSVISYTKTNKLITALYMVTDIIDKDEPLRNKLRTLGVEILSDIVSLTRLNLIRKIQEVLSFLEIASAMNIISEMNCSILKKEFLELNQSILSAQAGKESTGSIETTDKQINLAEFFKEEPPIPRGTLGIGGRENFKRHTRIGVQKGSTLMRALADRIQKARPNMLGLALDTQGFDIFKKQRRNDIINIIKTINGNATIKDIKDKAQASQDKVVSLISCSEKTVQRELISMVKDGVLNKIGEKRWSRYFLIGSRP